MKSTTRRRYDVSQAISQWALMGAEEVAGVLSVSKEKAKDLMRSGQIPYRDVGTPNRPLYRVDPLDLVRFIVGKDISDDRAIDWIWKRGLI